MNNRWLVVVYMTDDKPLGWLCSMDSALDTAVACTVSGLSPPLVGRNTKNPFVHVFVCEM